MIGSLISAVNNGLDSFIDFFANAIGGLFAMLTTVISDAVSALWWHVLSPFFMQGWVMITETLLVCALTYFALPLCLWFFYSIIRLVVILLVSVLAILPCFRLVGCLQILQFCSSYSATFRT